MESEGIFNRLKRWYDQPFSGGMDATGWFLFVGLLLLISFAWTRILNKISEA